MLINKNILFLSHVISWVGIAMLIISLLLCVKRTGDVKALFWGAKAKFTKIEYLINRGGLMVVIIGWFLPIIVKNI